MCGSKSTGQRIVVPADNKHAFCALKTTLYDKEFLVRHSFCIIFHLLGTFKHFAHEIELHLL